MPREPPVTSADLLFKLGMSISFWPCEWLRTQVIVGRPMTAKPLPSTLSARKNLIGAAASQVPGSLRVAGEALRADAHRDAPRRFTGLGEADTPKKGANAAGGAVAAHRVPQL